MAFAGMLIIIMLLAILCAIFGLGILFLIIGLILLFMKKKIPSRIFLALSGLNIGGVIIFVIIIIMPKSMTVETHTGEARIKPSWKIQYRECLDNHIFPCMDLVSVSAAVQP